MVDTTNIKVIADRQDIVAVADAVRAKTGSTNEMTLGAMATAISNIEPVLQSKTITPSTNTQNVTADSGYDGLDTVTVDAMPMATQVTPTISVDSSSGLITATATQSAGYVSSGTKSSTKQLTTKSTATITPGISNQTIASGTYLTGTCTIKGDANLVADNIKSGTSIFGVTGSYAGSTPNLQSKSVTYTANGTATITPDAGYDGMSSVDVTVAIPVYDGSVT